MEKPGGVKLGFRMAIPKWNDCRDCKGARNTFNVTPFREDGSVIGAEAREGCALVKAWGEFQRFQTVGVFAKDGGNHEDVELQAAPLDDDCGHYYILVEATNSDDNPDHWSGKTYLPAGKRSYCVSYGYMKTWRCQDGQMDSRGVLTGFGENNRGYDLNK